MDETRRVFLAGGLALVPVALGFPRAGHGHDEGLYERLKQPGRMDRPALAAAQHVFDSPAPRRSAMPSSSRGEAR